MSKPPDHAEIEKWVKDQPRAILDRLPDCPETRSARTHIEQAERLAH